MKMDDIQMISSDEEDDKWPERPCATPGWFQPNLLRGINKSSLQAKNCDNINVQNNRRTAINDLILSNGESRKRGRISDQGSSSSRKRPHVSSSTDSEPESFSNVQRGNQNFPSKDYNSSFSVISKADVDGPSHADRQPRNSYPEPACHSPFHFFIKNSTSSKMPQQGFVPPVAFEATSPVFNTRCRPSLLSESVEVLSSDDSEDSFIWTSSQMVAPPGKFCQQDSETVDVVLSDDENEIAAAQCIPRSAKKDCSRFIYPFTDRIVIGRDQDNQYDDFPSSVVRNCSTEMDSEFPISKHVSKIQHLNSEISDFHRSADADFSQIRDPMAFHPDVSKPSLRGTHSLFKMPVIVADCDSKLHASCRGYNVNIAPLATCASKGAASCTCAYCVQVSSPQPSSNVLLECEVVLKDVLNYRDSDSCAEVKSSRTMDRKWPASETERSNAPRSDQEPIIDRKPADFAFGNQPRNWSVSWDESNSESQSVLGNQITTGNLCRTLNTPVALDQPLTSRPSSSASQSGLCINVQRLSLHVDRKPCVSGGEVFFSDDDLFDEFALTQCDEAIAEALKTDTLGDSRQPSAVTPMEQPTRNQPNNELDHQRVFSGNVAETTKKTNELLTANIYSQQDDCIIVSDSDDEIFANLTQACMNPTVKHDSDGETVDDGWNDDDDDDFESTLLQLDESCFVVPQEENDSRIEPKVEIQTDEDIDCGVKSEYCEGHRLRKLSPGVKIENVKSYGEVEAEPEDADVAPHCRQLPFIKGEGIHQTTDCNCPLISATHEAVDPCFVDAEVVRFAFEKDSGVIETYDRMQRHVRTVGQQTSDMEDDVPIGELIEKQKVQRDRQLSWKSERYTEVKPPPIQILSAPSESPRDQFVLEADDGNNEDETGLPKFDICRSRLVLPKEIRIKSPPVILEVEVDDPVPVQTHSRNASESRGFELTKEAETFDELESDMEDEESYHIYLKANEPKVTKVNYLESDELEKSELVMRYYNFSKGDQWLSKTSPEKRRIHSPVASPRKRRVVRKQQKRMKSIAVPEKRTERSASDDQGHKIAQLRESHTLLKKALKPSLENRSGETSCKMDRSIRNAKNVMRERGKLINTEKKTEITSGESLVLVKKAGKVSRRRKTSPATFSSLDRAGLSSSNQPTVSGEKRGPVEEFSAVSLLDAILGPAEGDCAPLEMKNSDISKRKTSTTVANVFSKTSRKDSNVSVKNSEKPGGEFSGVFKRPIDAGAISRKKDSSFKIPRLSGQVTTLTSAETSARNTSVTKSFSAQDLRHTARIVSETLGSVSKYALVANDRTEVPSGHTKNASKESTAEATANRSNSLKTKLECNVSRNILDFGNSNVGSEVKKTLANAMKSSELPPQLPWSVTSKSSTSKSATPIAAEPMSSLKSVLVSSRVAPSKSLSVASKSSKSKSSTFITSKSSLPDMSESSSVPSNSSSKTSKSVDMCRISSSTTKIVEPQNIKSKSASTVKQRKSDGTKADGKTSTSVNNGKSSGSLSVCHKRLKDMDKHRLKNDRIHSAKSDNVASVQRSRLESTRTVEAVNDLRVSVAVDVEKALMLDIGEVVDNLAAAKTLAPVNALQDKWGTVGANATAGDVAGQTSDMQQEQLLLGSNKQVRKRPDVTKRPPGNLSNSVDEFAHNQRTDRRKPADELPGRVPVNEPAENRIEIRGRPTDSSGGTVSEANQSMSLAVPARMEKPWHSGFVEPSLPTAVVRPLTEQNQKRAVREVVRTTAPAMGRDAECITLSQIVNDSIRKTGPMLPPMFSEKAAKKRVLPDVNLSTRPQESESRKLTDLPRAKVDINSVLAKDRLTSAILYWNPAWMKECETVKLPPPIVNYEKVYPLLDTYDSFADYAAILQPLMLLEIWESMLREWKQSQRGSNRRSSRVMPTYLAIQKEQNFMFLHCQGVLTQQQNATGRHLRENDLVILNLRSTAVPPSKGQPPDPSTIVIKPVFGIVSKVNKHFPTPARKEEFLHPKIVELKRSSGDRCLAITYIVQFGYRKHPIDNSEFISVESVTSILPTLRQFSGLANLPRSILAAEVLRPSQWEVFHHNLEIGASQLKERFNLSQRDAISRIAKAVLDPYFPPKVCLLQGPPGTGKSHTVIGLVEHLLALNSNLHILLCAPSNAGIDELCRRLVAHNRMENPGNRKGISFVRLGATSSVHHDIVPYALQIQAKRKYERQQTNAPISVLNTLKNLEQKQKDWNTKLENCLKENDTNEVEIARKELKMLEKRKENISSGLSKPMSAAEEVRMKKKVLMGADVVCTTLNHSGSQHIVDMMQHQDASKHHFGCIIVDEACQCTEVECLIPLQYRTSKLVLVGDPEQLPPTVLSKRASDMNYGQSLFERLYNQLKPTPSSSQPSPVLLLQTQYRMHEEICHFSSKHFYYGRLKTDENIAKKRSQFRSCAFAIFDLQYVREKTDQNSLSISNPEEADFVVQLCHHLAAWMTPKKAVLNIGIITPYQSQRSLIIELFKQRCRELEAIEVGTVDGFQGREKDVIIVSCVRANSSRNIGFLADRRRMNVSLTRAKYALYVVGHMKTLTGNSDWSALVGDAQHRGRLVKVATAQQSVSQIQRGCSKT